MSVEDCPFRSPDFQCRRPACQGDVISAGIAVEITSRDNLNQQQSILLARQIRALDPLTPSSIQLQPDGRKLCPYPIGSLEQAVCEGYWIPRK